MDDLTIGKLKGLRDLVWGLDIPHPTIPEYVQWHNNCTTILKAIDGIIKSLEEETEEPSWYFTFGTSGTQVFDRGWVRVIAENEHDAVFKFLKRYANGKTPGGAINCCSVYSRAEFEETSMFRNNNNLGFGEHEVIY